MSHGEKDGADDFGRAVSNVAVAQICEAAGFHSFKESALEALADIAVQYLRDLGKTANFYANLAGRSECNVFDVIRGLEDLQTNEGFSDATEAGQCLAGSSTVREILDFVESREEVPFAQPIPQFPIIKHSRTIPSFIQMDETPPNKHIPAWLPALPDPHSYIHTPMWNERATDPREDKIEQARQRRKAERSLLSLQQRLVSNGAFETSTSVARGNATAVQVTEGAEKNPDEVVLPSKRSDEVVGESHISVVEAFAPAIELVKNGLSDDGQEGEMVLPAARPTVHFKFRTGKKLIGESLDMRHQTKGIKRAASLVLREEERDDKKRRFQYILKQSMENPQELNLL
ncbi:hypothetical protein L6164_033697 [Bauhinia variegata]|uniref:Uncharacterized protein n=1 Tax=Bauhinia variegata TaxID=167791 RepID=A0ACB9KT52_BAUVA|nr:hypothetical protein L6164_033697 [Bauhinia variegata]